MKYSIAAIFFAAGAIASPLAQRDVATATIALSNDQTGAYAKADIPLDGSSHYINQVYADSAIDDGQGQFFASSASMVGGLVNNPLCVFQAADTDYEFGRLTNQQTYYKFGDNPDVLTVIDLSNSIITCGPNN